MSSISRYCLNTDFKQNFSCQIHLFFYRQLQRDTFYILQWTTQPSYIHVLRNVVPCHVKYKQRWFTLHNCLHVQGQQSYMRRPFAMSLVTSTQSDKLQHKILQKKPPSEPQTSPHQLVFTSDINELRHFLKLNSVSPTSKRIKAPKTFGGKEVSHLDADEWIRSYHDAVRRW